MHLGGVGGSVRTSQRSIRRSGGSRSPATSSPALSLCRAEATTPTRAGSARSASGPPFRRRGIGEALLRTAFAEFCRRGERTGRPRRRRGEPDRRDAALRARRHADAVARVVYEKELRRCELSCGRPRATTPLRIAIARAANAPSSRVYGEADLTQPTIEHAGSTPTSSSSGHASPRSAGGRSATRTLARLDDEPSLARHPARPAKPTPAPRSWRDGAPGARRRRPRRACVASCRAGRADAARARGCGLWPIRHSYRMAIELGERRRAGLARRDRGADLPPARSGGLRGAAWRPSRTTGSTSDETFEEWRAVDVEPEFDPALWFLARRRATSSPAFSLCLATTPATPTHGFGRDRSACAGRGGGAGSALALLRHSFVEIRSGAGCNARQRSASTPRT